MRDLIVLVVHLTSTVFRLALPGGLRSVVAESVLMVIIGLSVAVAASNTWWAYHVHWMLESLGRTWLSVLITIRRL